MSNLLKNIVIVDGIRTPFAKAGGELKDFHPVDLAAQNLKELIFRLQLKEKDIDEVVMGNVANPSDAVNIARVSVLRAGLSQKLSAFTVHRNCASSLESLAVATAKLQSGMSNVMLAGGVESMSQIPFLYPQDFVNFFGNFLRSRTFGAKLKTLTTFKLRFLKPRIGLIEALHDPVAGISMGETAEVLAKEFGIDREAQDQFAFQSHQKAVSSKKILQEELFPVFTGNKYEMISEDKGPREKINKQKVSQMRPYFDKKYGTVTVANSCPITDGSALLLLMTEEKAKDLGYKPLARIRSIAFAGLDPKRMGLGPVHSTPLALKKAGLTLKDIGLVEINEAFAAQVLACLKAFASDRFAQEELGLNQAVGTIPEDCLNVNGGAIALGHPVSATGARLALTLAKEMKRRKVQFGLATLCIGGGQGGAVVLENVD